MADESDEISFDKPVEKGKNYRVEIEDLGSKGDGIARVDNFVVFVPEADVGETVEVEITSVGRRFAFGEIVERDVEGYEKEVTEEEGYEKEPEEERYEKEEDYEKEEVDEGYEKEESDDQGYEKEPEEEGERYDKDRVEEEEPEF